MNEVKILFADLFRMIGAIKGEAKEMQKIVNNLPYTIDWMNMASSAETVMQSAIHIRALSDAIARATMIFIEEGPYEGQKAGLTPLEALDDKGKSE